MQTRATVANNLQQSTQHHEHNRHQQRTTTMNNHTIRVTIATPTNTNDVRQVFEFQVEAENAELARRCLAQRMLIEIDWFRGGVPELDSLDASVEMMASNIERRELMGLDTISDDEPEPRDDRDWSRGDPDAE
jgi:hypothetical protein